MDLLDNAVLSIKKLQGFINDYTFNQAHEGGFIPATPEKVKEVLVGAQDALLGCAAYIQQIRIFNGGMDVKN